MQETSASAERTATPDDIFHDAHEDPSSGPSSLNTSPGIDDDDDPNSGMKGNEAGGSDTSLEATPRQPPLLLEVSPWDKAPLSSNSTSPTSIKSARLPATFTVNSPGLLKGLSTGVAHRRGSLNKELATRRSSERSATTSSNELQLSPAKSSNGSDQSAFWKQFKSKFARRAKEEGTLSPSCSTPAQAAYEQISTLHSPAHPSPYKISLSESTAKTDEECQTTQSASLRLLPWSKEKLGEAELQIMQDPLLQVLTPSISPRQRAVPLECEHPLCSKRNSSDFSSPSRQSPSLSRSSMDASTKGCQRSSSIRKLKKRAPSIRRASLSLAAYRLVNPEEFVEELAQSESQGRPLLVLDTRPAQVYARNPMRLRDTVNVNVPSLLIKRFRQGNFTSFTLKSFLPDNESQQKLLELCPSGSLEDISICIVDEDLEDSDLQALPPSSVAAALAGALATTRKSGTGSSSPTLILRGRMEEVLRLSGAIPGVLVHFEAESTTTKYDAKEPNSSCPISGITSGRLFTTPTLMTSLPLSKSLDASLPTPKPDLHDLKRQENVTPLEFPQVAPKVKGGFRKAKPLQLSRIDTSGVMQRQGFARQDPSTPRGEVPGTPLPRSPSVQESCPPPELPRTAFVHVGNSAPSRLPTIVMPDDTQATPRGAAAFTVSVIIPGFLYLGPEPLQEEDIGELESVGIKRILNVATECSTQERWSDRFEKIATLPMRDSLAETNVQERFEEACLLLDDADLLGKPTFVHCKAGKSRSVTIILAYLIHRNHWPLKRAYAHVLDRRKGVSPNIGFVAELMRFEEAELGGRSKGILGSGLTPANEQTEYFQNNQASSAGAVTSETKVPDPRTPRSARSDLEGRPTVVRHLSFIASTAMGINSDKPRTRDQRSSTHVARNRDSMPPGMIYAQYSAPSQ